VPEVDAPKRLVVVGAEVVVVVPKENVGAEVFAGSPRLKGELDGAVVLRPENILDCVDCWL